MNRFNEIYQEFIKVCKQGEMTEEKITTLKNIFYEMPCPDDKEAFLYEMLQNIFNKLNTSYDVKDLKDYQKLLNAIIVFNEHFENILNGHFDITLKKSVAKDVFGSLNSVLENLNHYYQKLFQTNESLTANPLPLLRDCGDTETKEAYVTYIQSLFKKEEQNSFENLFKEVSLEDALDSYVMPKEEEVKEEILSLPDKESPVLALSTKEERIDREIVEKRRKNLDSYIKKLYEGMDENRVKINKLKYKVLQEEIITESEVSFYNECILKIQCFSNEATRLEQITDKDIQDVYENLNIPNLDMSIEEIYDYLSKDEKYSFTDMKEIRKPVLSLEYKEEPKEEVKEEKVIRKKQFVPYINSSFKPKYNTKMYTDYTFTEEARPLFISDDTSIVKEIVYKDEEGQIYRALCERDSLKYQEKGYIAFAIGKSSYEYYKMEDLY